MSDRIKGITVEIGGDTTNLSKSLESVNKSIHTTQSQLRDVSTLLKLDPGNTELLKQKQEYLNTAIGETETKLKKEKEALQAAHDTEGYPPDKMQALEREVVSTTEQLTKLKNEVKDFGSIASQQFKVAGEKIQDAGSKISSAGSGLTKNITAPIAAIGTASIAAFNSVDAGMDIVTQKTGATGDALTDMQNRVKDLATTIPTDFETAGSAVGEVNTRFGLTGDALETLSGQFIKFASLNNTDVSTSVDNVQKVLAAFGLSTDNAASVLDTLNAVGQATGISMDTLASSMSNNAAAFQQMGFSAYDSAQFLGECEVSGTDVSAVMTGLKKALKNASDEGVPLSQALSEVQDSMKNASSDTDGLATAIDLFGSKSGPAIYNACQTGALSFTDLSSTMSDFTGNVDQTFTDTLDPVDQFTTTLNQLKLTGADVGNSLMVVLVPILQQLSEWLKQLSSFWNSLSPGMQDCIIKILLIAAAIGPLLVGVGKVVTAIGSIVSGIGTAIGWFSSLSTTITNMGGIFAALTSPVGLAIAAIAAVIAIVALLITHWDEVKEVAGNCWSAITGFATDAWNGITSAFGNVGSFFGGVWDAISSGFAALNPFSWGSDLINGIANGIFSAIGSVTDAVSSVADTISSWLHFSKPDIGPLKEYETWMPDFVSGLAQGIDQSKSMVTGAMTDLTNGMSLKPSLAIAADGSSQTTAASTSVAANSAAGDITIPVYIGNEQIDTIVVKASQRVNYRSGGR